MSETEPTVHIVDDDPSFLAAISLLLRASGFAVKTFSSASNSLAQRDTDRIEQALGRKGDRIGDMTGLTGSNIFGDNNLNA
jgi:DNA-binding NtrC family response regulator